MIRRIPIIPTLIVFAAVAVMVWLGFWQLDRLGQKEALMARYAAAQSDSGVLPATRDTWEAASKGRYFYRRAEFNCGKVFAWQAVAGSNDRGQSGFAHIAQCIVTDWLRFDGPNRDVDIVVGWSNNPKQPVWSGGKVTGVIAQGGELGLRLVADPPLAGLQSNAKPDPRNLANNHLSYAVQWFLFALTALVIYALALRKRLAAAGGEG